MNENETNPSRRDFLKIGAAAGMSAAVAGLGLEAIRSCLLLDDRPRRPARS